MLTIMAVSPDGGIKVPSLPVSDGPCISSYQYLKQ